MRRFCWASGRSAMSIIESRVGRNLLLSRAFLLWCGTIEGGCLVQSFFSVFQDVLSGHWIAGSPSRCRSGLISFPFLRLRIQKKNVSNYEICIVGRWDKRIVVYGTLHTIRTPAISISRGVVDQYCPVGSNWRLISWDVERDVVVTSYALL